MLQTNTTYLLNENFRKWLNYNRTTNKVKTMLEDRKPTEIKGNIRVYTFDNGNIRVEVGHKEIAKNTKHYKLINFFADAKGSQIMTNGIAIYAKKENRK